MSTNEEIGRRVLDGLGLLTQSALAAQVDMTADAMSRAVRGQRGFSSVELAEIADVLEVDVYWLITGHEDPMHVQVAARHDYNHETGKHSIPGRSTDEQDLGAVELAYRQAYLTGVSGRSAGPATPAAMREALGDDFVRDFAYRVEERLGVDVIRLPLLSTAYSLTVGGHAVIVLPTAANWFRSNSDLAHELGHLALGHHNAGSDVPTNEAPANSFATELLLPAEVVVKTPWHEMTGGQAAKFLWDTGVSGVYLRNRLDSLGLHASEQVRVVLNGKMPGALRPHMSSLGESLTQQRGQFKVISDPIDERMKVAAQRRFPLALIAAHRAAVESGRVVPATLAWMLDCGVDDLFDGLSEVQTPSGGDDDFSDFSR